MQNIFRWIAGTSPEQSWSWVILLRLYVGVIFIIAGIPKVMDPDQAAGNFAKMGVFAPEIMGPFVGVVELVCGFLVLIGLLTRLAAIPLAFVMLFALYYTKLGAFMDEGFMTAFRGARLDLVLLITAIYLVIAGAGRWAVDRLFVGPSEEVRYRPAHTVHGDATTVSNTAPPP